MLTPQQQQQTSENLSRSILLVESTDRRRQETNVACVQTRSIAGDSKSIVFHGFVGAVYEYRVGVYLEISLAT
jgi:hypothetical protein